jgi:hypothetical protein
VKKYVIKNYFPKKNLNNILQKTHIVEEESKLAFNFPKYK